MDEHYCLKAEPVPRLAERRGLNGGWEETGGVFRSIFSGFLDQSAFSPSFLVWESKSGEKGRDCILLVSEFEEGGGEKGMMVHPWFFPK